MDVELYIYDLSQGLARQYSAALTGVHVDAIYHTSIVLGGVEYFFGQGIHRKLPGSTHHGRPMKVLKLGKTELPMEVVQEYISSLESIYTPESYDLFLHNCNNFSQDLAMFLVGKSIPEEIRTLPETFLQTPIGQMLRGQLDQSMRQMTQAPDAVAGQNATSQSKGSVPNGMSNGINGTNGVSSNPAKPTVAAFTNGAMKASTPGRVQYPKNTTELDRLLQQAEKTCAVVFFTSATCPPCKIVYPAYDGLADEAGDKAVLMKVDVSKVYDIAMRYQIRATPTFITFLKGKKHEEWSGAHEARLLGNVRLLIQTANPQHPHTSLRLPSFSHKIQKPIMYAKLPPLDKLVAKIGPVAQEKPVQNLVTYIKAREKDGLAQTPLPNLHGFSDWITSSFAKLPVEVHFAVIDLVRVAAVDTRVSSYLAAESEASSVLRTLVPLDKDWPSVPYNVQAVTLQLICNLFGSAVFQETLLAQASGSLRAMVEQVASGCLLAQHHNARSLAAATVYNLAAHDHNERIDGRPDQLGVSSMSDLEAALVEAVVNENENKETLHSLLLALGLLLYAAPMPSSIWDLCSAMDVRNVLKEKAKNRTFAGEPLINEVGEELLGKGSAGV